MADTTIAMEHPKGGVSDSSKVIAKDFVVPAVEGEALVYVDKKAEARMMLKFDIFAVGLMGCFYMTSNLDRSNLGNAQTGGLPQDLKLVGNQFGTASSLFWVTYVPFEWPAAILLKAVGPRYLLTFCAFAWGVSTLCTAFVQNVGGLYACRMLVGAFEAGLIPCINIYIGGLYKRSERGKRSSIIYAFSALASAFGGLLAYGLLNIKGPNGFAGWRWLFVVEGLMTLLLVPLFFFCFPNKPLDAWFLNAEEKAMMKVRYENNPHWGVDDKFSWSEIAKAVKDPKWYLFWVYQFSIDCSVSGFTTFLPNILKGLGNTTVTANLLTVPVYMWGLVWFLFVAYMSDRMGKRGPWIIGPVLCLVIGYAIFIGVSNDAVKYFACFIVIMGIYPTPALNIMWINDNVANYYKRASMVGLTLTFGNCGGVASGQFYTTATAPRYIPGISICMALAALAVIMVSINMTGMHIVNKRREKRIRDAQAAGAPLEDEPEKGDYNVYFRYSL